MEKRTEIQYAEVQQMSFVRKAAGILQEVQAVQNLSPRTGLQGRDTGDEEGFVVN